MLTLFVLLAAPAHADRAATAERLADRLREEFLVVGTDQGTSIPAGWRNDRLRLAKWADATVALGWYLGALATEQALAERGLAPWVDQDADARLRELHHALFAVERLDRVAESAFPEPCARFEEVNGFFIRDDVPADFHTRMEGLDALQSDYIDSPYLKEMSQDQVHHLDVGLALVKHHVAPGTVVEGRDLRAWAVALGTRILSFVAEDRWVIHNPACDDKLVDRGAAAEPVAVGLAAVASFLSDGELHLPTQGLEGLWDGQRDPEAIVFRNSDNLHMAMATAAVGHGWGDTTQDDLLTHAEAYGWWAYPLLHLDLHGGLDHSGTPDLLDAAGALLDELGEDDEPISPAEGVTSPHGWVSWHRFIRPSDRHYVGRPGEEGHRSFGGDWLLLHHLTTLVAHDRVAPPDGDDEATACGCASARGLAWWPALLALAFRRRR